MKSLGGDMTELSTRGQRIKLTITAFLLTFITGILVVLPFVVQGSAQSTLNINAVEVGKIFSYFMIGMVIMQFLNGYIIKYIKPKTELFIISIIYLLCILGMYKVHNIHEAGMLACIIVVLGLLGGVIITIPNYIIVHSFQGKQRTTRLNLIDFFFSVGSSGYPYIVSWLFVINYSWRDIYATVLIVWVVIIIMLLITKLPELGKSTTNEKIVYSKWNVSVILVGIAIFCFFISYTGFTYILQGCLQGIFTGPYGADKAATYSINAITIFLLFYAIGCIISSIMIHKVAVNIYIIISAVVASVAYILVYHSVTVTGVYVAVAILGLGCATTYSSSIAYGSHLVEKASPRLISFFIVLSGLGTFAGEYLANIWYNEHGYHFVMMASVCSMALVAIIYIIVTAANRGKKVEIE